MAEGLGSLANSFLAGFNTMNSYHRGKKADERADKQMSLREAESQRNADHQAWSRERTEQRDTASDERWNKSHKLQKDNADQTNKRGWARLSMQQRQAKINEQRQRKQDQQLEQQQYLEKNAHIIQAFYNDPSVLSQNPDLIKVFENPAAEHLHPGRFADPKLAKANKTVMGHFNNIINMGAKGELEGKSDEEIFSLANPPEVTKALEVALKPELSKSVGDIDENTGMVITKKHKPRLVPGPSGEGVIPIMEVVYEDGSVADKPATIGRGTDADSNVVEIPYQQLIQYFGSQGNIIKSLNESGVMAGVSQSLGYSEQPDRKPYQSAATGLLKEEAKLLASVDKQLAENKINDKVAAKMKQGIRQTFTEQGSELRGLFGAGVKSRATQNDELQAWASGDPTRQAFTKEMAQSGALKDLMANPERRDSLYIRYQREVERLHANEKAAAIQEKMGLTPQGPGAASYQR